MHFPPEIDLQKNNDSIVAGGLTFEFESVASLEVSEYLFAREFNKLEKASKVTYEFQEQCEVSIEPVLV